MTATYDKTPPSPTIGDSLGYIGYKALAPRPRRSGCQTIEECPDCPGDEAFKYPVVEGDLIYMQFNVEDNYNHPDTDPIVGWYTGDPSDEYYISAVMEFGTLPDLQLPSGDIVESQNVGYANGSYQNLILNATEIMNYIQSEGLDRDCFRIKVTYYSKLPDAYTIVVGVEPATPVPLPHFWTDGDLVAINASIYIVVGNILVFYRASVLGEIIFNTANGGWYEYVGGSTQWEKTDRPEGVITEVGTCTTAWYKYPICPQTVLINGVFGMYDCEGNYYGISEEDADLGLLPYQDKYRIEATLEMQSIFDEKEKNENDILISFTQYEEWLFRNMAGLPVQVIRRIANSFGATTLFLDSNEYINAGPLEKINESGEYWYIAPTVQRLLCEKTNDCNEDYMFNPIVSCPEAGACDDFTLNIYLAGVLVETETIDACPDEIVNIHWE
jgi:hypothetical protein